MKSLHFFSDSHHCLVSDRVRARLVESEHTLNEVRKLPEKRMGATYVGVRRAHSYSWSLSSPQQPLETEDSPTVSLAPQYTSQRSCRAREFFLQLAPPTFLIIFGKR